MNSEILVLMPYVPIITFNSCITMLVMCLPTDVCLTAGPGVGLSILAWSHIFEEIDHEFISMVIFIPSPESFKKG